MFQNIIVRAEQLMERSKNIKNWENLSSIDSAEACSLMRSMVEYAEYQCCMPKNFGETPIKDNKVISRLINDLPSSLPQLKGQILEISENSGLQSAINLLYQVEN